MKIIEKKDKKVFQRNVNDDSNIVSNSIEKNNSINLNDESKNKKLFDIFNLFSFDKISYVENKIKQDKKIEEQTKRNLDKKRKLDEKRLDGELRKRIKKKIKEKKTKAQRKRFFEENIEKAGLDIRIDKIEKNILFISFIFVILESIFLAIFYSIQGTLIFKIILDILFILTLGLILHYYLILLIFFIFIDVKIYKRKKDVDEVLPEYLQLVAANINAGIPIDQSLWLAVRPQFGVLSKEIEICAKKSITGTNLNEALLEFSRKYDSVLLKRTIHLITEGIDAGGPLATLLDRITKDIVETNIMKKEMAANVMTYVIFITFASIVAAPFMFGLANQLVLIITGLMGSLDTSSMQNSALSISQDAILIGDFRIFSVFLLSVTAIFSGMIISVIKNGNIRDGLKNIPPLIIVSLIIYFISINMMGIMFSGMI